MDHREWIERYGQAWRAKDAVAVTNLFTDDAIYRSTPTGAAHIGSTAIAAYWRKATVSQNQLELRFGTPVVADQRIAVEWWATLRDPDWNRDATNDLATLPGCLILTFADDGRCAELREYYNPLFGQAVPPPVGWGV